MSKKTSKVRITDRDKEIKAFLRAVIVADTETIHKIFFKDASDRVCQSRLRALENNNFIKSFRPDILSQKIWYVSKKPSSYLHKIAFSKLLGKLHEQGVKILKYRTPFKIGEGKGSLIADGFIAINVKGVNKIYLVEVDRCKRFDLAKYLDCLEMRLYKDKFPIMPSILSITDKQVKKDSRLDIKTCKLDFSDLDL